ncbi:hypothetical protein [uncultured Sphingomonas sp.]|uniref:hypothetical protein n=1 Tax=uncultured Sphingomonas sp. TaxID=158754 RepID=UPI0025F8FB56|nr:hypothetical protein [uncultured Sphingomonas sp.]
MHQSQCLPWQDEKREAQLVYSPAPYEGVQRALLGSFGSTPAMPTELTRLLDRLR